MVASASLEVKLLPYCIKSITPNPFVVSCVALEIGIRHLEIMTISYRITSNAYRCPFTRTECLTVVAILGSVLLGCSAEDSAISTDGPCIASVVEPSKSKPSLVGPPDFSVDGNSSRVVLQWDASSNAFGYQIYIGTFSRQYHQVADVGLMTEAAVNNLIGDTTYYFAVTSYNSGGESCLSNEVSAHIP